MQQQIFKVRLVNLQTLGAACGYGEGKTHEEAKEAALRIARETDPDAFYEGGSVCYRGGVNR